MMVSTPEPVATGKMKRSTLSLWALVIEGNAVEVEAAVAARSLSALRRVVVIMGRLFE